MSNKIKNKKPDYLLRTLVVLVALSLVALVVALVINANKTIPFTPPEFDAEAVSGTPDVPDGLGYLEVARNGMNFTASVCGVVNISDSKADIYFTNPESNSIWMKIRILDEEGNRLGESGLIRPGEYVKSVHFTTLPKDNSKIVMRVMTYEPDTYNSNGAISLNTVAHLISE